MKKLKFVGKFSDLKKHGYTFQRLYAKNYMAWWREIAPGHRLWVWRKGRTVEIDDLYDMSGAVAEFMLQNDAVDITSESSRKLLGPLVLLRCTLDRQTGTVLPYDEVAHEAIFYTMAKDGDLRPELAKRLIPGLDAAGFYKRYRVLVLSQGLVEAVRGLVEQGLVCVIETEST